MILSHSGEGDFSGSPELSQTSASRPQQLPGLGPKRRTETKMLQNTAVVTTSTKNGEELEAERYLPEHNYANHAANHSRSDGFGADLRLYLSEE